MNIVVDFKTLTRQERVVMSVADILEDEQLGEHAATLIADHASGGAMVGMTINTEAYGRVELNIEGFEPKVQHG